MKTIVIIGLAVHTVLQVVGALVLAVSVVGLPLVPMCLFAAIASMALMIVLDQLEGIQNASEPTAQNSHVVAQNTLCMVQALALLNETTKSTDDRQYDICDRLEAHSVS